MTMARRTDIVAALEPTRISGMTKTKAGLVGTTGGVTDISHPKHAKPPTSNDAGRGHASSAMLSQARCHIVMSCCIHIELAKSNR
jgi:hypothetical protein